VRPWGAVEVLDTRVARVEIEPAEVRARQGDVIDFSVRALDAEGGRSRGSSPSGAWRPGGVC
jgi:hypothetical protein